MEIEWMGGSRRRGSGERAGLVICGMLLDVKLIRELLVTKTTFQLISGFLQCFGPFLSP